MESIFSSLPVEWPHSLQGWQWWPESSQQPMGSWSYNNTIAWASRCLIKPIPTNLLSSSLSRSLSPWVLTFNITIYLKSSPVKPEILLNLFCAHIGLRALNTSRSHNQSYTNEQSFVGWIPINPRYYVITALISGLILSLVIIIKVEGLLMPHRGLYSVSVCLVNFLTHLIQEFSSKLSPFIYKYEVFSVSGKGMELSWSSLKSSYNIKWK